MQLISVLADTMKLVYLSFFLTAGNVLLKRQPIAQSFRGVRSRGQLTPVNYIPMSTTPLPKLSLPLPSSLEQRYINLLYYRFGN